MPPVFTAFGGLIPRTAWHNLPDNAATYAHNVKLRNGKLEAWRERKPLGFAVTGALTAKMRDCKLLSWPHCVALAEYLPDYDRFFISGRMSYAETVVEGNSGDLVYSRLGVPSPNNALSYAAIKSYGRDSATRSYVYTYVNEFGEEGQPSYPGAQIVVEDGTSVTISGFMLPPAEYAVTGFRLYRTATGYRTGAEKEQAPITDFMLVAELPLSTTQYTDTLADEALGPVCSTRETRVAPDGLRHIAYVEGTGTLVGVTDNQVHFTKNMQPWNWPAEYDMTLPHNIIGMRTLNRFVFVSTDAYSFVIDGNNNCEVRQCRSSEASDYPVPDIACGYANNTAATPFGMVYASVDGLILLTQDAKWQVITAAYFGTDEWRKLRPDTARLAFWRGYIICTTDVLTFMLEIDGKTYEDYQVGALITLSDNPIDMSLTNNGELLMLENGIIYQWEASDAYREYEWISKPFTLDGRSGPNTAKIKTDNVYFSIYGEESNSSYGTEVFSERPVRLGRIGRNYHYRAGFRGTGTVDYAEVGTALMSVNRGV